MTSISGSSVFGFYFVSILVVSSEHCCANSLGFSLECVALHAALFSSSSFIFVRGASVLRTDSLVEGLSSLTLAETRLRLSFAVSFLFLFSFLPPLFFSAALTLRYRNAVCLMRFRLEP